MTPKWSSLLPKVKKATFYCLLALYCLDIYREYLKPQALHKL